MLRVGPAAALLALSLAADPAPANVASKRATVIAATPTLATRHCDRLRPFRHECPPRAWSKLRVITLSLL
jgi:hypothetical protein